MRPHPHASLRLALAQLVLGVASVAAAAEVPKPAPVAPPTGAAAPAKSEPWKAMTKVDFASLPIDRMPPDDGNVSPIASESDEPAPATVAAVKRLVDGLPKWAPGHGDDPVQRVRNYLMILGAADVSQSVLERYLPAAVLGHMLTEFPPEELAQILCWIAKNPEDGDLSAMRDPLIRSLSAPGLMVEEVQVRVYLYAVKFTRWVIGW